MIATVVAAVISVGSWVCDVPTKVMTLSGDQISISSWDKLPSDKQQAVIGIAERHDGCPTEVYYNMNTNHVNVEGIPRP